jgi:hypothetical protein
VSDAFYQSDGLTYIAVAIGLLAGTLVLLPLCRRLFRRRLRASGKSGRLGIVKSFALDRRRKLIVIHRDDVEHLIVTGRPKDVVIETSFVGLAHDDPSEIAEEWTSEEAEEARPIVSSSIKLAERILVGPGLFPLACFQASLGLV